METKTKQQINIVYQRDSRIYHTKYLSLSSFFYQHHHHNHHRFSFHCFCYTRFNIKWEWKNRIGNEFRKTLSKYLYKYTWAHEYLQSIYNCYSIYKLVSKHKRTHDICVQSIHQSVKETREALMKLSFCPFSLKMLLFIIFVNGFGILHIYASMCVLFSPLNSIKLYVFVKFPIYFCQFDYTPHQNRWIDKNKEYKMKIGKKDTVCAHHQQHWYWYWLCSFTHSILCFCLLLHEKR